MIVCKFGGTSVADAAAPERLARVVASRLPGRVLVVVSALAGVSDALYAWALAVGTRTNLLPVILFLSSMALAYIYQSGQKDYRRSRLAWLALSAPLLMGMAAIAWYNYVRFGSVLESGHRYQLTGLALPADYGLVTSFRYILPNLYSYLARLPRFELRFPFVSVPWIRRAPGQDLSPYLKRTTIPNQLPCCPSWCR